MPAYVTAPRPPFRWFDVDLRSHSVSSPVRPLGGGSFWSDGAYSSTQKAELTTCSHVAQPIDFYRSRPLLLLLWPGNTTACWCAVDDLFAQREEQVLKLLRSDKAVGCEFCGQGARRGDLLEIEYTAKLEDGKVFDGSSIKVCMCVRLRRQRWSEL